MKQIIGSMIVVGALTLTTACSTSHRRVLPDVAAQNKYHDFSAYDRSTFSMTGIRYQAIRDSAMSVGARAGLAWRAKQINETTQVNAKELDLIYNFTAMLLDHNVLPPVLIEGRQTLEQSSDEIIRVADRSYSIQSQARFVTMAPTWRDYLFMNYPDPGLPDASLLPKNGSEKLVWDKYIDEGWQAGVTQADVIFTENLGRLKRDYNGMVLYKTLLAQNMVSLPFVAQVNFGVTGGDAQMAINDRMLRITVKPEFNVASQEWQSIINPEDRQPPPDDR